MIMFTQTKEKAGFFLCVTIKKKRKTMGEKGRAQQKKGKMKLSKLVNREDIRSVRSAEISKHQRLSKMEKKINPTSPLSPFIPFTSFLSFFIIPFFCVFLR